MFKCGSLGKQPRVTQHRKSAALTSFKALYPFTARNNEELSFGAEDVIEVKMKETFFLQTVIVRVSFQPLCLSQVDETTEREEGWLYGSRQGKMGWFPESYVEKVAPSDAANNSATVAVAPKVPLQAQLSNALEAAKVSGTKSAFTPTHSPNSAPSEIQGQVRGLQSVHFTQQYCSTHILIAHSFSVYVSAGGR